MKTAITLERLYNLQCYSLPRFVLSARPYVTPNDEHLVTVLQQVTIQQEHMASKIADAVLLRGGRAPKGTFPMEYASLHDLELRYLLTCILREQHSTIATLDELTYALRKDGAAQQLAREVRRKETTHLRLFQELCQSCPPAGSRVHGAEADKGGEELPAWRDGGTRLPTERLAREPARSDFAMLAS